MKDESRANLLEKVNKVTFEKQLVTADKKKSPPEISEKFMFGRKTANHMIVCDFIANKGGWQTPMLSPLSSFQISPDALILHYGQEIFEGLKAYRSQENGKDLFLFRPEQNAARFQRSAKIMGMEPVPQEIFLAACRELVVTEADWVLPSPWTLYLRPTLISLDNGVSVRPSTDYRFFVFACPVQDYFDPQKGAVVYVERERVRASVGGVGEAKCGGNYAASLSTQAKAKALGADQVLWLDAKHLKYVEEVGAMNVMFVYENKIVTPELTGSILHGVTRDSIIKYAKKLKINLEEKRISVDSVIKDAKSGKLLEAFGCGTAAIISPIRSLIDGKKEIMLNKKNFGHLSLDLREKITGIQFGSTPDPMNWRWKVL